VCGCGDSDETAFTDHDVNLERFLQCCVDNCIKLNLLKTDLRKVAILFMGHHVTKDGLKMDPDKEKAILQLEKPDSVESMCRLLGFVSYLARFLPKLSDVLEPLRHLTVKDVPWVWGAEHDRSFDEVKRLVTTAPVLSYYDPDLPLVIQCDASEKGIGCALLQKERPVAYSSRALTATETRYAQIEKEMLAIVFSLEKFNQYTYGRHTIVHSDHKPLESIVKKPLTRAPRRPQGMIPRTQKYDYEIVYLKGKEMHIADMLSRSFLPNEDKCHVEFEQINMAEFLPVCAERLEQIRDETQEDLTLQNLKQTVLHRWPERKEDLLPRVVPFFHIRDEITVQGGLLFRGERVIVPDNLRNMFKKLVHSLHLGVESFLRRARECLYWPGMSAHIKEFVMLCDICCEFESCCQSKETLLSHELASRPWQKVGSGVSKFCHKVGL
jgi:hypothetical protein